MTDHTDKLRRLSSRKVTAPPPRRPTASKPTNEPVTELTPAEPAPTPMGPSPAVATPPAEPEKPGRTRSKSQANPRPPASEQASLIHRRDQTTTYYLGAPASAALAAASDRLGLSRADTILTAIRQVGEQLRQEHQDSLPSHDILDLPPRAPRQRRGSVKDGRSVQAVLSAAERDAIQRFAGEVNMSASELVSRCLTDAWPTDADDHQA